MFWPKISIFSAGGLSVVVPFFESNLKRQVLISLNVQRVFSRPPLENTPKTYGGLSR